MQLAFLRYLWAALYRAHGLSETSTKLSLWGRPAQGHWVHLKKYCSFSATKMAVCNWPLTGEISGGNLLNAFCLGCFHHCKILCKVALPSVMSETQMNNSYEKLGSLSFVPFSVYWTCDKKLGNPKHAVDHHSQALLAVECLPRNL